MDHDGLFKCPVEVLQEILTNIYDSKTLLNVCLAGNHTFLSIAQPLLWRDVHWQWDASLLKDGSEEDPYQHKFKNFCSKRDRVKAVRNLKITVFGKFDVFYGTLLNELMPQELPSFINVSHATIDFSGVNGGLFSMEPIGMIFYNLPALLNLHLEGCDCNDGDFKGRKFLSALRSVSLWYCNSLYVSIARDAPNLEVIELMAGAGIPVWERVKRREIYRGYRLQASFLGSRMIEKAEWESHKDRYSEEGYGEGYGNDEAKWQKSIQFLRRFAIRCHCLRRSGSCPDTRSVSHYFQYGILHPDLEELIIDLPLSLDQYRGIISKIDAPNLKRVFFRLEIPLTSNSKPPTTEPFVISFKRFSCMNELWLPFNGLDPALILSAFDLQANSELKYLYFDKPDGGSEVDLTVLAHRYASHLPSLQSLGWKNTGIFSFDRSNLLRVTQRSWSIPAWLELKGIGPWWEILDQHPNVNSLEFEEDEEGRDIEGYVTVDMDE